MMDLKNAVDCTQYNGKKIMNSLEDGKTVITAFQMGPKTKEALELGYVDYYDAKIKLIELKPNAGVCGCGLPGDGLFAMWRE